MSTEMILFLGTVVVLVLVWFVMTRTVQTSIVEEVSETDNDVSEETLYVYRVDSFGTRRQRHRRYHPSGVEYNLDEYDWSDDFDDDDDDDDNDAWVTRAALSLEVSVDTDDHEGSSHLYISPALHDNEDLPPQKSDAADSYTPSDDDTTRKNSWESDPTPSYSAPEPSYSTPSEDSSPSYSSSYSSSPSYPSNDDSSSSYSSSSDSSSSSSYSSSSDDDW